MALAASSDIVSVSAYGNCAGHSRTISNAAAVAKGAAPEYKEDRLVINCPVHEALLRTRKDSWGSVTKPPLTDAEKEEAEQQKTSGLDAISVLANALMAQASAQLTGTASSDQPATKAASRAKTAPTR